jgi:hypothetical protein
MELRWPVSCAPERWRGADRGTLAARPEVSALPPAMTALPTAVSEPSAGATGNARQAHAEQIAGWGVELYVTGTDAGLGPGAWRSGAFGAAERDAKLTLNIQVNRRHVRAVGVRSRPCPPLCGVSIRWRARSGTGMAAAVVLL